MKNDALGSRMKEYYENRARIQLMRRTPVIIRLDGKAFHTFTKGFDKPFDLLLTEVMQETMKQLCQNIQGCVLGYTQSDEISLVLVDYKKLDTSAWFDNNIQKICSVSASLATLYFNKSFQTKVQQLPNNKKYLRALDRGALFDGRCFNVPKEEVTNYLFWRQLDAKRNSIQSIGQANFSHKELQGKSSSKIQELLSQKNINLDMFADEHKLGSCSIRDENGKWVVDRHIPLFKDDNRFYVENLIG